ncbi:hypothetical protein B5C34_14095 [Pacificimonas flava]|uniref:Uncharacterized protein n=2 Tax=Pacificimonas TaxID=1960290 RepID=A0A219B7X0_9SPHN|nr:MULTISPECIES: efflux RND transporter periplasmic adaptor subunit [Pacificimonas]MBZ6379954.1 efflux RND transporter periplasmic adaptor subunit [Pacificimonas aurantium]OWV34475.1 hypothetical protein B5C34_14095 [Pacificimonas flava]
MSLLRKMVILTAGLALAGCGQSDPTPQAGPERALPVVQTTEVRLLEERAAIPAVGTVRLRSEVSLGFTSPGQIASIAVDEGDRVREGQLLASLNRETVEADLATARAEADRAQRDLERSRDLFTEGWVTRARLDDVEAAVRAADARVDSAAFAARTARIVAPSSGVVLQRFAEPGQVVDAGQPILSLGRADQGFVLAVPLTDRQAAALSVGAAAQVRVEALGEAPLSAQLVELAGRADPATGTFAAEFSLPSRSGLRSGQIGRVMLPATISQDGTEPSQLLLPASALTSARAGGAVVWVVEPEDTTARPRTVATGDLVDEGVVILEGLKAGERVVTAGADDLVPGQKVEVR